MKDLNCTILEDGKSILCNGIEYVEKESPLNIHDTMFWVYIGMYAVLVIFAGLMSGLTLGLLSLDMTSLLVVKEAGTPSQKRHAAKIIPLVKRHHLLLVTLLLANAAAVETMPLFLDRVSDPITAILVSVTAVLFFGEVFPQALCSRFGLAIGATLAPLVYVLMFVSFIISWPVSKLLDCLLGNEHATFFRRAELKALVDLHGPTGLEGHDSLTYDEVLIIKGALELRDKSVKDAMVPLESVFMLDAESPLNQDTLCKILQETHSRIPVFEHRRENIIGILLVKTLACHPSSGDATIRTLLKDKRISRRVHFVDENKPLYDLLNTFQKGKTHLAVVTKSILETSESPGNIDNITRPTDTRVVTGIITLEDILEELLQEEIIDETDIYVDVRNRIKVARARAFLGRSASTTLVDAYGSRSTVASVTVPSTPRRYLSVPGPDTQDELSDNQLVERSRSHAHVQGIEPNDRTPLLKE